MGAERVVRTPFACPRLGMSPFRIWHRNPLSWVRTACRTEFERPPYSQPDSVILLLHFIAQVLERGPARIFRRLRALAGLIVQIAAAMWT